MRTLIVAVCLLLPLTAEGAQIFEKVGTLGGQSLKIGVGARAAAMVRSVHPGTVAPSTAPPRCTGIPRASRDSRASR